MRTNPHIIEINTAEWLNFLKEKHGRTVYLGDIPQEEIDSMKNAGFDAVWLMGVWKRSPKSIEISRNQPEILNAVSAVFPQYDKDKMYGSPYAVYDYSVDRMLGTDEGLKDLRKRFNEKGMALLLDFVGNHYAVDHPLTLEHPEYFVNTGKEPPHRNPEWFFKTEKGDYIAHGRDPYFPPWTDTSQLDYFNPETVTHMTGELLKIASMCDGVRCDMAMLSINKVHKDVWGEFIKIPAPNTEVATTVLNAVRKEHPNFVFIAEVYWGLEWDIQEMGFDYTYDKVLYDRLRFASPQDIKAHLGAEHLYQMRSIRFIANHDEEAVITAFGKEKSLAAAAIISTISGARMFMAEQLHGFPKLTPIQYVGTTKQDDYEVASFYAKLLDIVNNPAFHGGQWGLKETLSINDSNTNRNILSWTWMQGLEQKLVVINYSQDESMGKIDLSKHKCKEITEEFEGVKLEDPEGVCRNGLYLNMKPYEVKIYTLKF